MPVTIYGQTLLDSVTLRLGGAAGAFNTTNLMDFINDGIGKTWSVLKALGEDYFVDDTQSSDSSSTDDYIATIASNARTLTLPANTREIRFIECTTEGYQHLKFEQRRISDEDFQDLRRAATDAGTTVDDTGVVLFALVGADQLIFADYPPATLTLVVWRVKSLNTLAVNDTLSEILHPFQSSIVNYAVQLAQLTIARETLSDRWLQLWQASVREIAIAASPRVSASPTFIPDYFGA